jgi:hypothetical protein
MISKPASLTGCWRQAAHQTYPLMNMNRNRATALGEPLPSGDAPPPAALKLLSRLTQALTVKLPNGGVSASARGSGPMASLHLLNWNLQRRPALGRHRFCRSYRWRLDHRAWRTCSKCCW